MSAPNKHFNRSLLTILLVLYLLTLIGFSLAGWTASPESLALALLNAVVLGIPIGVVFASIYVLVAGWHARKTLGQVNPGMAKAIYWAPRLASILLILFMTLFSLDIFAMDGPLQDKLLGLLIHNLPALALLALLVFIWRRPRVGFLVFLVAALFFFVRFFLIGFMNAPGEGLAGANYGVIIAFVLPMFLIAALFYADWKWLTPHTPPPPAPAA